MSSPVAPLAIGRLIDRPEFRDLAPVTAPPILLTERRIAAPEEATDRAQTGWPARVADDGPDTAAAPVGPGTDARSTVFDWPVFAQRDEASNTGAETIVSGNLLANDYIRNPVDDVTLVAGPRHGTVTLTDTGTFSYHLDLSGPDVAFMIAKGEIRDSFVYRVEDTDGDAGYARVHVTLEVPDFGFSLPRVGGSWGEVSLAGDINGDGIDDIIVGDAYVEVDGAGDSGAVYVIFGQSDGFDPHIDLEALDGTDGFRLALADPNLFLGAFLDSAGDINGDGIDDFLIGSYEFIDFYGPDAGQVFVVFGQEGVAPFGADFDLASLDGTNGFRILGYPPEDIGNYDPAEGVSILRGLGDINGDGLADFSVGTEAEDTDYIIFGGTDFDADFDLGSLDGSNGVVVGSTLVDDVGDVNGDGRVDLLFRLSTEYAPDPDVYFIDFGADDLAGQSFVSEAELTSGGGVFITMGAHDEFTVVLIGDVDGDGIVDVGVQSTGFDSATDYLGATYILYGADVSADDTFSIDVTETAGTMTSAIPHLVRYNQWSDIAAAGDINGDGIDDFLISETYADTAAGETAGAVYLVFGQEGGLGAQFDLTSLDGDAGYVFVGAVEDGELGMGLSAAGDVNGDGHDDFIIQGGLHFEDFIVYGGPDGLRWMDAADGSLDGQIGIDLLHSGDAFF